VVEGERIDSRHIGCVGGDVRGGGVRGVRELLPEFDAKGPFGDGGISSGSYGALIGLTRTLRES